MKTTAISLSHEKKIDGFDRWEVESAASDVQRAMELKKNPKLLKAALKMLEEKQKSTQSAISWAEGLIG